MKDCKHVALISSLYCMIVKNKTILVQNDMRLHKIYYDKFK